MKQLLITILAAALLVVCFAAFPVIRYMLSFYTYEIKELIIPSKPSIEELVGMSIYRASEIGNTEAVKKIHKRWYRFKQETVRHDSFTLRGFISS